jgi:predicted kinase
MTALQGSKKPFLVVMSGAPGSGKSTLARILGDALRVPHLERDIFFDSMNLTMGDSFNRGNDGIPAFYDTVQGMLAHGVSLVIDGTLYAGKSEADIKKFFEVAQVINVHCRTADPKQRFRERELARAASVERREWVEGFMERLDVMAPEVTDPLALDWEIIDVDTTGEYNPSISSIVEQIKRLVSS